MAMPVKLSAVPATKPAPTRAQILALEHEMRKLPQIEIEPKHHHSHGLYAREILIKANTLLTGMVHLKDHLNFLMKGRILVWTEQGMRDLTAPQIIPSFAGTKRVGLALEDTIWVTVHATEKTNLAEIEAELIEPEGLTLKEQKCLG